MKYLSRLTALLLAFVLLFSSSVGVIAESDISDLTRSGYDQMVSAAKEAAEAEAAAAAQEAASQPIINEGGVVYEQDIPEQTKRFDIYEVITDAQLAMGGETEITLPQSGKINLSAGTAAQWQIYIPGADMWVNIAGETGDTFALTYAVIGGMLSGGSAKVRALAGDSAAVANISVAYGSALPPVEEEDTFVAEAAAASTFSLRRSASTSDANAGIMLAADAPDLKEYSVVINYYYENNEIAADPYTATLAAGSNFTATVNHPTVMGYLPYIGNDTETSTKIDLKIENIQAEVTYTVTYKPTNVDYTVIHYQQNVDNDNYTIAETETKQGLTNSQVPEVAKSYDGFYALIYEKPTIAADGSTIVEVYYDRYYYLMNFVLGEGGYGVEPIYARYGTPVDKPATPIRAGYTFSSWNPEVPSEVPFNGGTYTAQWTAVDTAKVTVVFWGENADDEGYSYIKSSELYMTPGTEYTFGGGSLTCTKTEHTHDVNCYNWTCTQEEHTHSNECLDCKHECDTSCYTTDNGRDLISTSAPSNLNYYTHLGNGIYSRSNYYYYVKIGDNWYCGRYSNGYANNTVEITYSCSHEHSEAENCYDCGKTAHTHGDNCRTLICTLQEHVHSPSCYTGRDTSGDLDTKLYTFRKSDTQTVAADGSTVINVYYDRTTFTLTFHYDYEYSGYQTTEAITDKWGADIGDRFLKVNANANGNLWSKESNGNSPWTSYLQIMPQYNEDFYCNNSSADKQSAEYYTETLTAGEYKLEYTVDAYYSYNLTISKEDFYEMDGFTYDHGTDGDGNSMPSPGSYGYFDGAKFYYTRNSYNIVFNDGYSDVKTVSVKYEAPLSTYKDYVPEVPSAYEPGSVEFGGWYLNPECTGDEYVLSDHTMPAENVLLYAYWSPVKHTVTFYLDQNAYDAKTPLESHPAVDVPHGSKISSVPEKPTNGSYEFVGWFYMENGVEKAFDFANMTVNKDLHVYGKWSSKVLKQYVVYFKIQGTDTEIADPVIGSKLAGETKTFDAKGGDALYVGYREGYFPVVKSHSITLNINTPETPRPGENDEEWVEITNEDGTKKIVQSFTFWYVQKKAVPYTVYYVAETLKDGEDATKYETIVRDGKTYYIIAETYTNSENRKAVVTEKFKAVAGYMPDAYQKRLVVDGTDGVVNEVIFYYTVDTQHAYYKITHYTQNTDGQNWTEYASSEAVGDINKTYKADPLTIDGFTYDSTITGTVTSGVLTANGLELKLYYTRNPYPYQVRYLEDGTGAQLAEPKDGTGLYGQVISERAIGIENYTAVDPTSQTLTIKIEASQTEAKLNIITFYYTENEVTINYEVVGPTGCGTVDTESETLKVLSGEAKGSTATAASSAYKFVGWFTDAECKNAVDSSWLSENGTKIVPPKQNKDNDESTEPLYESATYYAKFEENVVTINYVAVGPKGATNFGSVNPTSEALPVLSGTAAGSTATPNAPTYKFVGWYLDEACTRPVDASWVGANNKLTPAKTQDYDLTDEAVALGYAAATYYAKFEYDVAPLTISKDVVVPDGKTYPSAYTAQEFTFTLKYAEGVTMPANFTATKGAETLTLTPVNGVVTFTLKDNESIVIKGVQIGDDVVTITETAHTTYDTTVAIDGGTAVASSTATVDIDADGTAVTFTNTAKFTSLTITKRGLDVYAYNGDEDRESAIFTVTVSMGDYSKVFTIVLPNNGSATITDLPIGASYSIDEQSGWTWRYSDATTAKGTLVVDGTSVEIKNSAVNESWLGGDNYKTNKFN